MVACSTPARNVQYHGRAFFRRKVDTGNGVVDGDYGSIHFQRIAYVFNEMLSTNMDGNPPFDTPDEKRAAEEMGHFVGYIPNTEFQYLNELRTLLATRSQAHVSSESFPHSVQYFSSVVIMRP